MKKRRREKGVRSGEIWYEMTDGKEWFYVQVGKERKRMPKWAIAACIAAFGELYPPRGRRRPLDV